MSGITAEKINRLARKSGNNGRRKEGRREGRTARLEGESLARSRDQEGRKEGRKEGKKDSAAAPAKRDPRESCVSPVGHLALDTQISLS